MKDAQDVLRRVKRQVGVLAKRAGDPTIALGDADDERLMEYLSEGLIEMASRTGRFEGHEQVQLLGGTGGYGVSGAARHMRSVTLGGRELRHIDGAEARAHVLAGGAHGLPTGFGMDGGAMWLVPVPSAAAAEQGPLEVLYTLNGDTGQNESVNTPPSFSGPDKITVT